MAQLTYRTTHLPAYVGGRADSASYDAIAGFNAGAAALDFGQVVARGTASATHKPFDPVPARALASSSDVILGVALHDTAREKSNDDVPVGDVFSIIRRGRVYVTAGADVEVGDPVHVNVATGALTNEEVEGDTVPLAASWGSTAQTGDVAVLELNLP